MRRAVLLFNPISGRHSQHRLQIINRIADALRARGLGVEVTPTISPGSAGRQAAAADTADIIFACGGDGTIHEVLQGAAFHPRAALGLLPLGTGNVLARHIGLPADPVAAALAQLGYPARTLPLGLLEYTSASGPRQRYFLVMAGAGPDGELVRASMDRLKLSLGRAAYHVRAARLFLHARFPDFNVRVTLPSGDVIERRTAGMMAIRGSDLGGIIGPRTLRGAIAQSHLQITILKPPVRLALLAWLASGWVPVPRSRLVETFQAESLTATAGHNGDVQVQADGEWLGHTPLSLRVVPDALRMLLPPTWPPEPQSPTTPAPLPTPAAPPPP